MPGSDVVIVQKDSNDGHIYIQDRFTYAYAEPRMDDCQSNGKEKINTQFFTTFNQC